MLLKTYMAEAGLGLNEMAKKIAGAVGGSASLTDMAVFYWANGRRMPKTEWIEAIRIATDGAVTAEDHHQACLQNRPKLAGEGDTIRLAADGHREPAA